MAYNATMPDPHRVAATITYEYSGTPKGCRKTRTMSGSRLAVIDLIQASAARYPIVYSVTERVADHRQEDAPERDQVIARRWGEGRLWCPYAPRSELATVVSQCLSNVLHGRYDWYRLSESNVQASIDRGIAEVISLYRVIEGELYRAATEQVWVVEKPCRYRGKVEIALSDEPRGELVFRLDELDQARAAAAALIADLQTSRDMEVVVEGAASVERPDLLQRPSGRLHTAAIRSWRVIESVRESTQLLGRLEQWLLDPMAEALPPGLTVADGLRLRDALLQMRGALAGITDEQTASHLSAA